ncbi:MAG: Unknown protein [uncultured Sulfurovum sp.]|uniref:Cadherin domain-containing protein n=1 Tax=uncultured Sulfurovum sp. TaxID=269237 RepID=A0A6S6UKD2_9BACT|nr:MAG: Unknown protein [uncultured Sulfurovum sp.]
MLFSLKRKIITFLVLVLIYTIGASAVTPTATPTPTPTPNPGGLADAQLHAVMGIITNFILSGENPKTVAFNKIRAYASSNGNTSTPSIADYIKAQIVGVDSRTLTALNDTIALMATIEVDTTAKIQQILDTILSTPPVLTLVGDANLTLEVNTPYTELGATAIDALDGNLTSSIVITGSVDIQTLGKQTLTYSVTDTDNNTATVERNITVVDTTPPTFTSEDNTTVAENQTDAITLQATDSSAIAYSISGGDSTDFDVNATTGVVTFKVAPDFETKDMYTFTATATDAYGNEGTQEVTIEIDDVDEGIVHNGSTYGTVISPHTGKEWLDRNLGANRVCTSFYDTECYGDYYQWGRNFDGHQESNSTTTATQATDVNATGSNFITSSSIYSYDWAKTADSTGSLREANWSGTDGSSVCPVGFRVPTLTELNEELFDAGSTQVQNRDDAFNSFLALPSAGFRINGSGFLNVQGSWGYLWTSSVSGSNSSYVFFGSGAGTINNSRAYGFAVRCLRD